METHRLTARGRDAGMAQCLRLAPEDVRTSPRPGVVAGWFRLARACAAVIALSGPISGPVAAREAVDVPIEIKEVRGDLTVQGVSARNGDVSLTYSAFEGDDGISFGRTYRSLSVYPGLFGRGWGSVFDTRLIALPDGRIAVREDGNGAVVIYGAAHPEETSDSIERVVAAAENAPVAARVRGGETLVLDPVESLTAAVCDEAGVIWNGKYWVRGACDNSVQLFDRDGRLTQHAKDGYQVRVHRSLGKIRTLSDNFGRKWRFHYSREGLRITVPKGDAYSYDFDPSGYAIRSDGPQAAQSSTSTAPIIDSPKCGIGTGPICASSMISMTAPPG